jgi:adenosylhomocysteine nucleosidase
MDGLMSSKSTIAVCFALQEEAGPFKKFYGETVPVFLTGIGRENADKAVRQFLSANTPALLLTCGFAGGLLPELKLGDVVFEIRSNGSGSYDYAETRAKLTAAGAKPGKIFCADRIATTVDDKKKLRDETGADAAEMESGAVQDVCRERGVPCVTVRVISDTAGEDLPLDFNKFLKADKTVDMGKLLFTAAMSPTKMGALMELQKKTKLAAQQLAEVLAKVIGQPVA